MNDDVKIRSIVFDLEDKAERHKTNALYFASTTEYRLAFEHQVLCKTYTRVARELEEMLLELEGISPEETDE